MSRKRRRNREPGRPIQHEVAGRDSPPAEETTTAPPATRRVFLWKAWFGLALVATAEFVWVLVDSLRPRRRRRDGGGSVITAGPVDRFPLDSVTAFPQAKFYLVRLEDGGFLAVSRECTHLGCTIPWVNEEHRFVCPCHSSAFDIRGDVVNPPAPRALDIFEVRIENRVVKVNTATARKRRTFEAAQVHHT